MARRTPKYFFLAPKDLQQVRYRAKKSLGLCARCGTEPSPQGRCCASCRTAMAAGKQQARDQGLCLDCWTEPVLPGKRYCVMHDAQRKADLRQRYWTRRLKRLCTQCGKKRAYKGGALCREHRQKNRERVARHQQTIGTNDQIDAQSNHRD